MADLLIVEDEKNMQEIIVQYMKRGGHTCFTADDGIDALMTLKNHPGYYDTKPGWFLRLQNGAGNEQSSHYHADRQRKRGRQTERLSFGR